MAAEVGIPVGGRSGAQISREGYRKLNFVVGNDGENKGYTASVKT
jgi:hypothetical protein